MKWFFVRNDVFAALFISIVSSLSGIKLFKSWSQVNDLWARGLSPIDLINYYGSLFSHPHTLRYSVVYPGLLLETALPTIGFSLYVCIFFGFNVYLFRLINEFVVRRRPSLVMYLIFILFQFVMNGRGVFAWCGWLLCYCC